MVYELMAAIGNTPATGDTFPVKTLIIVAAVAVAAAIAMTVLTKGRHNEDEGDAQEDQEKSEE